MTKTDCLRAATEVHLCNNPRHLFFALADVIGRGACAVILYLEDEVPFSNELKTQLATLGSNVQILFSTDAAQIDEFTTLPAVFPDVVRRNLRLSGKRATQWLIPAFQGRQFDIGYIYHPGFFTAKPLVSCCRRIVMRESGLNNYVTHKVPFAKGILRFALGLPRKHQTWGEESWVDAIQVGKPDDLPRAIRHKAQPLSFAQILAKLTKPQSDLLASIFIPVFPVLETEIGRKALLLTQPLDRIGIATLSQKHDIYEQIAAHLVADGYQVFVKHHPTDDPFALSGTAIIDGQFPIELWPLLQLPKFDLAVALCSASLEEGQALIADQVVQYLPAQEFNVEGLKRWRARGTLGLVAP